MFKLENIQKKVFALSLLLLVVSGLNWGLFAIFKTDAVSSLLGKGSLGSRIIFLLIAAAALYVGLSRDSYLPFLGQTIIPCSLLNERTPEKADLKVRIIAPVGKKVLYWAASAESKTTSSLKSWQQAYGNFENAGVAISGEDGSALLQVERPQSYWVPPGRKLEPHVHYRICSDNGMMGPVRSLFIEERVEGFGTAIHL
jgi:uncharacterized membrane protein YuzA (DUF378 family)